MEAKELTLDQAVEYVNSLTVADKGHLTTVVNFSSPEKLRDLTDAAEKSGNPNNVKFMAVANFLSKVKGVL